MSKLDGSGSGTGTKSLDIIFSSVDISKSLMVINTNTTGITTEYITYFNFILSTVFRIMKSYDGGPLLVMWQLIEFK